MHTWKHGKDWVIFHDSYETHPESKVIVRNLMEEGDGIRDEMTIPWGVLVAFVADALRMEEQAHTDNQTAEEWLRARLGVPRR